MPKTVIKLMMKGGEAKAGPQLAQPLSPLKVNIAQVVAKINEKTKEFAGIDVPVEVIVDMDTKEFEIKVGTPPVASLIKKEIKLEKLARAPWGTYTPKEGEKVETFNANITLDQIIKIARAKEDSLVTHDFKKAVKQVVSTCVSSGVTIDGKHPKEIIKDINDGKYDDKFK